jgi:hypothetical protein
MEKIYQDFERRKMEAMKLPEFKEKELGPEKEKEILKEVVSQHIEEAQVAPASEHHTASANISEIKSQPKERQVQYLVDLALEKGIAEAVHVARSLDNSYLVDELHDAIADRLYSRLVEEGKLKKV